MSTQATTHPLDVIVSDIEKHQNGVAGLKHWRYDLMAGLQVAMVGIPLSLGIAIASGAPPVCGLISTSIAGFVFPFLGGAYITISGPAAGNIGRHPVVGEWRSGGGLPARVGGYLFRRDHPGDLKRLQCREICTVFSHLGRRGHVDGDRHAGLRASRTPPSGGEHREIQ